MKNIKFGRYYNERTPPKIKHIADSILFGLGSLGAGGLFAFDKLKEIFTESQIRWGVGVVLCVAFLCYFLSNFFTETNNKTNEKKD